jgi:AbrB family looped-hinge helix DNA binding protein
MGRNGRITIPAALRKEFSIEDGAIMNISKKGDIIVIKPLPPIQAGEPVGEEEFKKMLTELDEFRSRWR